MTATTEETMRSRVRAGISLLEREVGPDFHEQIDLDRLNIASVGDCALGQLYGVHAHGCNKLGVGVYDDSHGFYTRKGGDYGELNRLWREELLARST